MPANVEVKVRAELGRVRERLPGLRARRAGFLRQRDTYFDARGLRLKLREQGGHAELIAYVRPDRTGERRSDYVVIPVQDVRFALSQFAARVVVDKVRELWMIGRTRVHLDRVRGLGTFVELETLLRRPGEDGAGLRASQGERECRRILDGLGLGRERKIPGSYADLAEVRDS